MQTLLIIALGFMLGVRAYAQLDTNLLQEMHSWRKGDAPPPRLLKFPDGKIDTIPGCGFPVIGSEVRDYIGQIRDADLLAALMLDYRAQADTCHAAASRLITLKGVGHVSRLLADQRKTEPRAFVSSELAVLSQLVRSPYVAVQVARIAREDMPADEAVTALNAMRIDLRAGASWADAYRRASGLHPDMRDRGHNPRSVGTLISYFYDSIISPSGFDIVNFRIANMLPPEHLRELFRAKRGTHVLKSADGVYLYHIRRYDEDAG